MNANWTCTPQMVNGELTVGEKYRVDCHGQEVNWTKSSLEVFMPAEWKYHFRILRFEKVEKAELSFVATTYKTGEYTLPSEIQLSDGDNKINLSPWNLKVASVIQQNTGKPSEPFGPFGPFTMEWPIWMWVTLGLFMVTVVVVWSRALFLRRRKKLWAKIVADNITALTPYHQFYKDFRKLSRISEPKPADLEQLDSALRLYFLRELEVPTEGKPSKWILHYLHKKNSTLAKTISSDVSVVMRELEIAKHKEVSSRDFEQLSRRCRLLVDRLWEGMREGEK